MKSTFKEAAIILIAAVIVALVVNALRPDGLVLFGNDPKKKETARTGALKEMDIQSVMSAFKSKNALFVDARSPDEFNAGHIRGAVNLPEQEFQDWIEKIILEIEPTREIIVYCSGIECSQAKDLAENLFQTGFINVSYFSGGFSEWCEYEMPVEKLLPENPH